jgi:hypothetical protein
VATQDLEIRIKQVLQDSNVLKALNKQIADVKNEMAKLSLAGKEGSSEWKKYEATLKGLITEKQKLNNSFKVTNDSFSKTSKNLLALGRDITVVAHGLKQFGTSLRQSIETGAQFGVFKENFIQLSGGVEQAKQELELLRNASTGNLDEQELIVYTNKMKLLGFSINDTAKLLDIVDIQSDKVKVSFEQGEKILQAYLLTGRDKSLKELGINVADVNAKVKEQTGLTSKQVKELDAETQQRIRLQAILGLNIGTVGDLNDKTRDNADKIKSVETALKNVTLNYQYTIANGIVKFSESLGISNKFMEDSINKIGFVGKSLADLAPVLATLKIAFPTAFAAALPVIGAIALQIGGLILLVKSFTDSLPAMSRAWRFVTGQISFSEGVNEFEKEQKPKTSEELGLTEGNDYVRKKVNEFQEKKKQAEEKIKLEKDIKEQMDALDKKKGGSPKAPKEDKADEEAIKKVKEEIYDIEFDTQKIIKETRPELIERNKLLLEENKKKQDLYNTLLLSLTKDESKLQIHKDINGLVLENLDLENEITDEKIKQLEETFAKEKKISDERRKERENDIDILDKEKQSRIDGITNEYQKERRQIDLNYERELRNIRRTENLTSKQRESLRDNAEKQRDKEVKDLSKKVSQELEDNFLSAFSQSLSLASQIANLFGEGASQVISAFQTAFSIVESIVALIKTINIISGLLSFIPGGGAIAALAAASGGYISGAGSGTSDSIPARLSNGEYVINAKSTAKYRALLDMINGGKQSVTNGYKVGGLVNRPRNTTPKVDVVVNTQLEKRGMYKVYVDGQEIANNRVPKKTLG